MNPEDDPGLLAIARAIASGDAVDWSSGESTGRVSASYAEVLRELRAVAQIADAHRSLVSDEAVGERVPAPLSADEDASLVPGTTWGPLTVLEQIGEGAFGRVYRAMDSRLEREVALKLLHVRDGLGQKRAAQLIIDEGRRLARVRHANVVSVHGADVIDGRVGIWMEFIRGRTLQALLRDRGPYGPHEAALIGLDVLRALSAVHAAGLVHRDIKAHNVMREDGGRIVLMDFGAGFEMLSGQAPTIAGTPLYLAPEVFVGARPSAQSDIYSVGVLLFLLVSGSYPVNGESVAELRDAHAKGRRRWLRDVRPDLPEPFVTDLEHALAAAPSERFRTAGEMERALSRFLSLDAAPSRAPRLTRRHVLSAGAALGVATFGIAAFGSETWRDALGLSRLMPAPGGTATTTERTPTRRRVAFPEYSTIGTPSADGSLFSFSDLAGNLAVVVLATGEVKSLTHEATFGQHSQYAEGSVISPDNTQVAYTWFALDGTYELRAWDLRGAQPRVLLRSTEIAHVAPLEWARNGTEILTLLTAPDGSRELAVIDAAGGGFETVVRLGRSPIHHASLSPDGSFVVYDFAPVPNQVQRDILIARRVGAPPQTLITGPATDVDPLWTPDGTRVLFLSDRGVTMDLWSVRVENGEAAGPPLVLQRNVGRALPRGLTNDGTFYYHEIVGTVDIYDAQLHGVDAETLSPLPTTSSGSNISSLWAPDGRALAYASRRGPVRFDRGSTCIVTRDLASGNSREITPDMHSFLLRAWSPDGGAVLVSGADAQGRTGMHRVDLDTAEVTPLLLNGPSQNDIRRPDWRDDGRVVYVNSRRRELLTRDPANGEEHVMWDFGREHLNLVSNVNGRGYRLSPDSQLVAYTVLAQAAGRRSIGVRDLAAGNMRELLTTADDDVVLFQDWAPDGSALYFTRGTADPKQPVALWRLPVDGTPATPTDLVLQGLRDVSLHPDGLRVTFTAGWPEAELWVLEGFLP